MKAQHLETLCVSMNICTSFIEYLVIFRLFLEECGIKNLHEYSVDDIVAKTIQILSENLNLNTVSYKTRDDQDNIITQVYYIKGLNHEPSLTYIPLNDDFRVAIGKPIFNIEDMTDEHDFLSSIKFMETSSGDKYKVQDFKTTTTKIGEISELDTFLSYFDIDKYLKINEIINDDNNGFGIPCHIIGEDDEIIDTHRSTDFPHIIHLIINSYLRG